MAQMGPVLGYDRVGVQWQRAKTTVEPVQKDVEITSPAPSISWHEVETVPLLETSYICGECGRTFLGYSSLVEHQKLHQEKCYECALHKEVFKYDMELSWHLKFHTELRPHKCLGCHQFFEKKSDLQSHQHSHRCDELHQCMRFGQCFTQSTELLVTHQLTHYGGTNKVTAKSETSLQTWQSYYGQKKRYPCRLCGRSFTDSVILVQHQQAHIVSKRIQCAKCDQSFQKHADLVQHEGTQIGEKP
ncbi:zinc finger protein 250-like isoform X2 [Ambystoma mexicanum]|uniref:zinc finger protein 250-like isoform X2 n=1 Tax=Ambystoma mexicanum TaxID=8296 RepID=UPI0037E8FADF